MEQAQTQSEAKEQQALKVSRRTGFWAGIGAGLAMTVLMVALRLYLNAIVLPELTADWLIKLTPPTIFDFILTRLQVGAKPLFFGLLLLGQVLAGGGIGVAYARYSHRLPLKDKKPWARGVRFGLVLSMVLAGLFTPLIGGGFFGAKVATGAIGYLAATFLPVVTYGVVMASLHAMALERRFQSAAKGRRKFLRSAAIFTLVLAASAFAASTIVKTISAVTPSRVFRYRGQLPPEVTPNDQFYEVSKNIINPKVEAASWKLEVGGDVGSPFSLTYEELKALPWIEQYATLECISNLVGGDLISNALWRGVSLRVLLERAKLSPDAQRIAFHAADGYVDSFPLDIAMREQTMVAYMMNGDPLPDAHGFPARIIVPGLWGMENVKWLTRIEPVAATFRGYWQERGWADSATYNTMSRLDVPAPSAEVPLGVEVMVGGVAFAGDRSIQQVEFSADDGQSWSQAEVKKALGPYTWVLWTGSWTPDTPKLHVLKVRAVDGRGEPQIAQVQDSLPDGATGYHLILVDVMPPAEQPKAS
ncbi:MAG: molybdopterin-dependent oxidoreductase [Chloroflexi bacterium]|nr:molybdopterin-dependent oxidoreductase [Chloroflexota bacterium]